MSAILQTRPQGEKSAERALEARGVPTVRPVEIIETRKRTAGGKQVIVQQERQLMPGYIATAPATPHDLDAALGDMSLREPRKDVLRVVGWASEASMAHVLARHGKRVEKDLCLIQVGKLAKVTAGAFEGLGVKVLAIRGNKARCQCGNYPADIPLDSLTPLTESP